MNNLQFKQWLSEADVPGKNPEDTDPMLNNAARQAKMAVSTAIQKKQDPIKAAQAAIAKAKIPLKSMGKIMPTTGDEEDA